MRLFPAVLVSAFLITAPVGSFAESLAVRAEPALLHDHTDILSANRQSTEGVVQGPGDTLHLFYSSTIALDGFIAPLFEDASYNHGDMLHFHLPAGSGASVTVDITDISSWSPWHSPYFLTFISGSEQTDATFETLSLASDRTSIEVAGILLRHVFTPELFRVSSFHLLFGYHALNVSVTVILGFLLVLAIGAVLFWKKGKRETLSAGIVTMLCFLLLYQVRFAMDLGSFSIQHLREWYGSHTYAQAGYMYQTAEEILRDFADDSEGILVCFDSTDYNGKLLRYLLSPLPVYLAPATNHPFDLLYVTKKLDWSFEDGILTCGDIALPAEWKKTFPDGSQLFSLLRT